MPKIKTVIGWLIAVATSATLPVQGEGVAVGYRQLGVVDVPDGVVSNVDSVVLGDQSTLYKTGAGTLAVGGGALKSVTDARLNVLEGNVSVTTSADTDFTTPPDVCNLAAFWVNESSVATTNGVVEEGETAPTYVSKWLDVRETNPASPTLHYALPKWCTSETYPATLYGIDPVPATFDGRDSVYFGGRESGQYMRWYKDGSAVNISRIRHVFIVQAITNCVGHIIGKTDAGRTGPYLNSIGSQTMAYGTDSVIAYPRADICKPMGSAGFFLDGKKIDARFTVPKRAWQLWEIDYYDYLPAANNFGYCGFQEGTILKGRQGMDYVGEVVVFTNQLKEAERAAVERYLLAKWDLPQRKQNLAFRPASTELALAEGASATVSGAGGSVSKPLAIAGAGTVTKDGDGTLALGPTDGLGFTGDFIWNAGKVRFQGGNLPPLTVSAREKYAFNNYNGTSSASLAGDAASGITCTKTTDAEAGTVQTTGNGWLRVHTVSNNVKKIKVGMGTANLGSILQLEGRTRTLATGPTAGGARATFPNPDLEIPFAISDTQFDRKSVSSGNTLNGWTSRAGTFNIMCTQAPRSARTWAQWVGETVEIPRPGTNILQQVGAGTFSTTVSVPAAGTYELSFDASSRYSYNSGTSINTSRNFFYADQQPQAEILFGQTWAVATTNRVGDMPLGCRSFERYRYRIEVPEAGSWILGFRTVDSGGDACLFMDNFEMVRVAEPTTEETFKIPNGNFDRLVRPTSGASLYHPYVHGKFCTLNEVEGWTLSVMNPDVYYGTRLTNGVIGVVTSGIPIDNGGYMQMFPLADAIQGSAALLFASTGGVATTTFTVPPGTWRLRALARRYPMFYVGDTWHTAAPSLKAFLTRGDSTTTELGTVKPATQVMTQMTWPTAFTVAADEQVTLTLRQAAGNAIGMLDDLELVKESTMDNGNLIANPGFEGSSSWSGYRVSAPTSTTYWVGGPVTHTDRPQYWGYSVFEGTWRLRLQNLGAVRQDLTVPQAGLHRFTMHVRARADDPGYGNNPVRVSLSQGATTNVLAVTPTLYSRNWMEITYLANIPTTGTWRLAIEGLCRPDRIDREAAGGSRADIDAHIDNVSLVRCLDTIDAAPSLPRNLKFEVAKGAQLLLDYQGTAKCGPVKYDGVVHVGTINASTCPDFVTGMGALEAVSDGTLIIVK